MATVVDLNGIKTQLKSIFDTANTTTASPIDLSSGMTRRVQKVLKVHPEMIIPQASYFPFVTCYIKSKSMEQKTISSTQANANKAGEIEVHVVGAVFNNNVTASTEDPADEDVNHLMENIELILRSNATINSKALWQHTDSVEYYSARLDLKNHVRFGVMKLTATVYY